MGILGRFFSLVGLSLLLLFVFVGALAISVKELEADEWERLALKSCCDEVSVVLSQLLVGAVSELVTMVTFAMGMLVFRLV